MACCHVSSLQVRCCPSSPSFRRTSVRKAGRRSALQGTQLVKRRSAVGHSTAHSTFLPGLCRALNTSQRAAAAATGDTPGETSAIQSVAAAQVSSSSLGASDLSTHAAQPDNAPLREASDGTNSAFQQTVQTQHVQHQQAGSTAAVVPQQSTSAIAAVNAEIEAVNRLDIYKAIAIGAAVSILAGVIDHDWVEAHQGLSMSLLFILGYVGIMVEELVGLNKAGVALLMAVSLWVIRSTGGDTQIDSEVSSALASVSEVIFFLLGAMTVVESVDSHGGFKRLANWVRADQRTTLAWGVGLLTFVMSAVLDNLTTTIVMISILQVGAGAAVVRQVCRSGTDVSCSAA
eukprot:GHUV01025453.1.p1 GENE.GHUV01025453.1~~GHUV01025453.1.p1  ORF type:complete len:345 (+),score=82.83 GHUV01025453.1:289-1323(+)